MIKKLGPKVFVEDFLEAMLWLPENVNGTNSIESGLENICLWWRAPKKRGPSAWVQQGLSEVQATGLYWPSVGLYNAPPPIHCCTMFVIHCPICKCTLYNTNHTLVIAHRKVLIQKPSYIVVLNNTFYSPSATTNIALSWSRQKNVTRDLEISSQSYFSAPQINSSACKPTQIQIYHCISKV